VSDIHRWRDARVQPARIPRVDAPLRPVRRVRVKSVRLVQSGRRIGELLRNVRPGLGPVPGQLHHNTRDAAVPEAVLDPTNHMEPFPTSAAVL
jgi:hypothetical protein